MIIDDYYDESDFDDDEPIKKEPEICPVCNGSGEGMRDGTTCKNCKGKGEI